MSQPKVKKQKLTAEQKRAIAAFNEMYEDTEEKRRERAANSLFR